MSTKTIIILGVLGVAVYFLVLAPKPQPTGIAGVVADTSKLIGDFSHFA